MGADITGWVKPNISVNLVRNMAERYKSTNPLWRTLSGRLG
jgi:hypothetical protein